MYDLVIRNGTVVDGSGLGAYRADVGVIGDKIARIGRIKETGRTEIDAEGHIVTPGFIDGHTHLDAQIFWDPLGTNACWHGVTTAVMGHCGFTLAPVRPGGADLVIRNIERAEDISRAALDAGIDAWDWETFPELLDRIDRLPKGVNYAANIGHSALRTYAMGERAFQEAANEDDMALMERELRAAMAAGALGFSTSRGAAHATPAGDPVASRLAEWSEIVRLVEVMADTGAGVFQLAPEREWYSRDPIERGKSWKDLYDLTVSTGVTTLFGIPLTGPDTAERLAYLDSAAAAGGQMIGITRCRGLNSMVSFKTRLPFDALPEWQEIRALPYEEQMVRFRDPAVRERLIHAAKVGEYPKAFGGEPKPPDYDNLRVYDKTLPPNPTVREVANARGVDPVEAMIDLALEWNFDLLFIQNELPPNSTMKAVLKHPRTAMCFSDTGAHVTQIADSSLQTYLLAYWVREREDFTIEEAVRMMTLQPARAWGFHDRGLVREGMVADLNVIDPQTVAPLYPRVVSDFPGGAKRLDQRSVGIKATIVCGEPLVLDGEHTGALPGRLLRGPLAQK